MAESPIKKKCYAPDPIRLCEYVWKLEIRDTDDHTITLPYMTRNLTIGIKNTLDQNITVKFDQSVTIKPGDEFNIQFDSDINLGSGDVATVNHITWLDRPTLTIIAGAEPTDGYVYIVMVCDAY